MILPTALIAEDQQLYRGFLVALLRDEVHLNIIGETGSVNKARNILLEHRPALAVLDWHLDDGNADELLDLSIGLPDTRWLICTGPADATVIRRALERKADGIVLKTSPPEELVAGARALIAGRTYFCPGVMPLMSAAFQQTLAVSRLRRSEVDILRAIAGGMTTKEISAELRISIKTVNNQRSILRARLRLDSDVDLANYAVRNGLIAS